jgi:TonB family protein
MAPATEAEPVEVAADLPAAAPAGLGAATPLDRMIELAPAAGHGPFRQALALATAAHLSLALAFVSNAPSSGFWDGGALESTVNVDLISIDQLGRDIASVRREAVDASPAPPLPKPAEADRPAERAAATQAPEDAKPDLDAPTLYTAPKLALPREAPPIDVPTPAEAKDAPANRVAAAPPAPDTQSEQIDSRLFSVLGRAAIDPNRELTVTASAGAITAYARSIVQVLDKRKPAGQPGDRGVVYVQFQIGDAGEVVFATVSRTSGKPRLDEAAVAAVQGARFPQPPPGTTIEQRFYETHFNFR